MATASIHIILILLLFSSIGLCQADSIRFLSPQPFTSYTPNGATLGHKVYQVQAASNNGSSSNEVINYTIISGDPANINLFIINTTSGIISNTAPYPSLPAQYNIIIRATSETSGDSVTGNLTIIVLPSYLTNPRFEHTSYVTSISENGHSNTSLIVTQAFSLSASTNNIVYTIINGNINNAFSINPITGLITVNNPLDRETVSQYLLTIRYIDDHGSVDTQLQILVEDQNDNSPQFGNALYQFSITEDFTTFRLVGSISATDSDTGINSLITYTLSGQYSSSFTVTTSGELRTLTALNYEQLSQYSLIVTARDSGQPSLSSTATVIIYVTNIDDECPLFSGSLYVRDIPYDFLSPPLIGDYILTIQANDPDNAGDVTYGIISGNQGNVFSLDVTTGNITLARNEDTIRGQYVLIVTASDASCFNESLAQVQIGIGSANEHSPSLDETTCMATLTENPPNDTIVTRVIASDDDFGANGVIRYEIVQNIGDYNYFTIDQSTGIVRTIRDSGDYDRETRSEFQVGITATDGGFRQDFCILTITLLDQNDNSPIFDLSQYNTTINNLNNIGSYIIQLQAQDMDYGANGDISYTLSTTINCPFIITHNTGVITVNTSVLNSNLCILNATATDHGINPRSNTTTVNLIILQSGHIPVFTANNYTVTIQERYSSISDPIINVTATVQGGGSHITYSISTGSEYRTNNELNFIIVPSGSIYVDSAIDYERLYPGPYSIRLFVSATTPAGISSLTTVTVNIININDERPEFINPNGEGSASITFDVVEGQPPGPIGIVRATDRDIGTYNIVHYELLNYNQFGGNFTIDEFNGTIYSQVYGLDAESNPMGYTLVVGAYNIGEEDRAAQIFVHIVIEDINDNPPSFEHSIYNIQLNETYLVGHMVVKLTAIDPDRNDQDDLVYTILTGNDQATFQLQGNTLLLKRSLDYESITHYTLSIQVSDGIHTDNTIVNIQVLDQDDEPPVFSQSIYYTSVVENSPFGTNVIRVNATDLDSSVIQYELTGLAEGRFDIDSTGLITVSGNIDREEFLPGEQIVFLVFAYGGSLSTADIIVNISDINDYIPRFIFAPFYGIVTENTSPGSEGLYVTTIKAVDLDKGNNGTLTYDLSSGQEHGFSIDPISGIIIANRTFDREATRFFMLVATATDNGQPFQLSSSVEVLVEINDTNDNPPQWIYPYMYARVYENSYLGKLVIQLPVHDPDNGNNATVHFELVSGNEQGKFNVTPLTGEVTVAGSLDYENLGQRRYLLYFSIRDIGTPPLSNQAIGELEIHVLDDNDHHPQFTTDFQALSILENTPINTVITVLTASDQDTATNSELTYAIIPSSNDFTLSVYSNGSVALITNNTLDYETVSYYDLTVIATDNGYPRLTGTININITLIDINDEPPMFISEHFITTIYENMNTLPISLLYTQAIDPDSNSIPGGLIDRYELIHSDDNSNQFNYNNGWLTAVQSLDRETKSSYHFTVIAIDNDLTNPLTGTATITVNVLDRNDNPSQDGGQLQVLIEARQGIFPVQEIGNVYFIDPDDNDTFTNCQIVSGDDHIFTIDSTSCTLSSTVNNFPPRVSYSLVVRGNDGVHASVTTSVSIIMHIPSIVPPVNSLLTLTLNISGNQYLNQIRSNIIDTVSSLLTVHSSQIAIISSQQGYYDPLNSVDLTMVVMETDGTYRNKTSILQHLYLQRTSLILQHYNTILYSLPIDLCLNEPCYNQGKCTTINTIHSNHTTRLTSKWFILFSPLISLSSQCNCLTGTEGTNCEINYNDCYSSPCQYGGTCIDGIQEYYCNCPIGTGGHDCSINPNECASNLCLNGGTCVNGFNEAICTCPSGYYGDMCQYAYFTPPSFCDSSPCMNNGTCSSGRDSFTCICTSQYTGQYCQLSAPYQGGCVNNPCYNGSTCIENSNGYTCTCSVGFTGPNCRFPLNNCELEYCRNEGSCERGLYGSYNCLCPAGYSGQYCTDILSLCYSSPCLNGGTCDGNTTYYYCTCPREYYGDNCQYAVQPTDLCISNECSNDNSICTSGRDNYTCFCTDGRAGIHCYNTIVNTSCDINPCFHGGHCIVNGSDFMCSCTAGYTGVNCEININDCIHEPCQNHGTCTDGIGHYMCTCPQGYTGSQCTVHCPVGHEGEKCQIDIKYCTPNSCHNGGTCIEDIGTLRCICPPQYTGNTCTVLNTCAVNTCYNDGTCRNDTSTGYNCHCIDTSYRGDHCELTTISFNGNTNNESYRAYKSLGYYARGEIILQFATQSSDALLLLNTQYNFGVSNDFIAVEIKNRYLTISYSLGNDKMITNLTVLSTSVQVTDGHWHTLLLKIKGKMIEATLDYCIQLSDNVFSTLDCTTSVTSLSNYNTLNLGLPLWLGGAPTSVFSSLPLSFPSGSDSCIRNVYIDGQLLDLQGHVDEKRSQNGCPQIDNTCNGVSCGQGTCISQWNNYYCSCPQQVTGRHCSEDAQGLTYDGQTLAQYTLLLQQSSVQGKRIKRETSNTDDRSNYKESVSLWFRTENDDGILFLIGNMSSEHILVKLQGGRMIHTVNLGYSFPTSVSLGYDLHDGLWHHVNVTRIGANSTVQVDHTHMSHTHPNSYLTLEYFANEFFIAGRHDDQIVTDGYTGCIQDIRLDHTPLPVANSNNYASVTYVGGTPEQGCTVGPCYPNPCHTGNCSESSPNVFLCTCLDGSMQTTPCEEGNTTSVLIGIAIAVAMGIFIAILIVVLIIGLIIISRYGKRKGKRYSLNDTPFGDNERRGFEVHANIHTYDEEGGEEDTPFNDSLPLEEDIIDSPHVIHKTHKHSPSMSTLDRDRCLDDTPTKLKPLTKPVIIHEPVDTPPTGHTPPVRGTPSTIHPRPATPPRASTPDIDAFIEDRVNKANMMITDIDSLKDYSDEGVASSTGSLSVLSYSSLDRYTYEQLVSAGFEFQNIATILEPVYWDDEEEEDESEEEQEVQQEIQQEVQQEIQQEVETYKEEGEDGSEEWERTSDFGSSTEVSETSNLHN